MKRPLSRENGSFCARYPFLLRFASAVLAVALALLLPEPSYGYAVLAHQAMVDVVWESHMKPLLHKKFPHATEQELDDAEAYAYGGSIVQDLGYYPYGSPFFSDLSHYVRSGDFVQALMRDSQDVDDYAFALGALAHYASDNDGHPLATNRAVPMLYPNLRKKFGESVTYEDNPLAHVKTEFGFDVLQVAQQRYAPEEYHDFIGFEVSAKVLEAAFQDTYGVPFKSVIPDEDKALNSYRRDVSKLIPKATRIAWSLKEKEIVAAEPTATHRKFLYNMSRAEFEEQWGKDYTRPTFNDRFLAFLYKLVPKIGPLRVLQFRTPTPEAEKLFEASFNRSLDKLRAMLKEESEGRLQLKNLNFDVGDEGGPGTYRLADETYCKLLHELAKNNFAGATPELRSELLQFFGHPDAPYSVKKNPETWVRVESEIAQLRQTAGPAAQGPVPNPPRTSSH